LAVASPRQHNNQEGAMPIDVETFEAAITLAAPTLAEDKLLYEDSKQALVVNIIKNAYKAIEASHSEIFRGK
jgi:hypothetical protein